MKSSYKKDSEKGDNLKLTFFIEESEENCYSCRVVKSRLGLNS